MIPFMKYPEEMNLKRQSKFVVPRGWEQCGTKLLGDDEDVQK